MNAASDTFLVIGALIGVGIIELLFLVVGIELHRVFILRRKRNGFPR